MNKLILIPFLITMSSSNQTEFSNQDFPTYQVKRLSGEMAIDADWNKPQWKAAESLKITNYLGEMPGFRPVAEAKVLYDDLNLYVIFRVQDRFVRSITTTINGPVWKDSCVEFFFSPNSSLPLQYFNTETNCGGTPLMSFRENPEADLVRLPDEEIQMIEMAHSLPAVVDPELTDPTTWTLEYRMPLAVISKYSQVTKPGPGVKWKANFFKIAEINSNPHYITWSEVKNKEVNFHQPQFFGHLEFL